MELPSQSNGLAMVVALCRLWSARARARSNPCR